MVCEYSGHITHTGCSSSGTCTRPGQCTAAAAFSAAENKLEQCVVPHLCVDAIVERVLHSCQAALLGLQLSRPA
jgi:hypothetical protein